MISLIIIADFLLSVGSQWNLPAEKEVIAGLILGSDHSVKDNQEILRFTCTIIWYRTISYTLSIDATITGKVIIEAKSCFERFFSMSSLQLHLGADTWWR